MKKLEGKTAVITGSNRGFGLAIAHAFAEEGANVVLAARRQETLDAAVEGLLLKGHKAVGLVCDTSKVEDVEALVQTALSTFKGLDIWVNNAGISAPYGPTISIPNERFVQVVETNILGVYYGSFVALRHFAAQGHGKLINMLGRGDNQPVPFQSAYASSKAWGKKFTQALAGENVQSGVEVMAFNPGLMITEMLTQVETVEGWQDKVAPLNTVMRLWGNAPELPAQKMVWMASSATDGKNGLIFNFLSLWKMMAGLGKEAWRMVARKPSPTPEIQVRVAGK